MNLETGPRRILDSNKGAWLGEHTSSRIHRRTGAEGLAGTALSLFFIDSEVGFRKSGSGGKVVAMMQTTEPWHGYNFAVCNWILFRFTASRRSFRQGKMSAVLVVVADVIIHKAFQMLLVQNNHMVEQVAAAVADETLGHGGWPGQDKPRTPSAPFIHRLIVDEWETPNPGASFEIRSWSGGDGAMPSGLRRFQRAESLHFITFSCFHRFPLLEAPGARETVEAVLEKVRARHLARVYAYVLKPEHVHLPVNEPPQLVLAQFLKAVKRMTSRKLRGAREKFWQARYYDSNVRGEQARSEVIRYIHRNPRVPDARTLCVGVEAGKARIGSLSRRLPMEQLQPLRDRRSRNG